MNQKKNIIGVVGLIGSGKGTVGDYLSGHKNFVSLSFAAALKDAVSAIFGWDRFLLEGSTTISRDWREQPDEYWSGKLGRMITPRLILQEMGTEVMRKNFHPNIWIDSLEKRIQSETGSIVITDVRFPNEADLIKRLSGQIVWVRKDPLPDWFLEAQQGNMAPAIELNIHESERAWIGTPVDWTITNNGTLLGLYEKIDQLIKDIN